MLTLDQLVSLRDVAKQLRIEAHMYLEMDDYVESIKYSKMFQAIEDITGHPKYITIEEGGWME